MKCSQRSLLRCYTRYCPLNHQQLDLVLIDSKSSLPHALGSFRGLRLFTRRINAFSHVSTSTFNQSNPSFSQRGNTRQSLAKISSSTAIGKSSINFAPSPNNNIRAKEKMARASELHSSFLLFSFSSALRRHCSSFQRFSSSAVKVRRIRKSRIRCPPRTPHTMVPALRAVTLQRRAISAAAPPILEVQMLTSAS